MRHIDDEFFSTFEEQNPSVLLRFGTSRRQLASASPYNVCE